jgi:purine nucleosidase
MRTKALLLLVAVSAAVCAAQPRMVLIDEDGSGPGGTNQMAMLALLQSPQVKVLGITIVTGDAWRDEETEHTLRMLELTGHADVPVARGAVFPLVRDEQETILAAKLWGKAAWLGAWGEDAAALEKTKYGAASMTPAELRLHDPYAVPPLPEGMPTIRPIAEDAAHFLIRQVHAHPHQVTIYAGGPLTDIALALAIDPHFAGLTKGIVLMGGSIDPQTDDPEFASSPRHEFNFWFDPEAAHMVLRAAWPRIDVTTVDVSIKAPFTAQVLDRIAHAQTPAARYITAWSQERSYMWDELAACAWLDPKIITKEKELYMDMDLSHGPSYGETLTWDEKLKPETGVRRVHAQLDVDLPRFQTMFVDLMTSVNSNQENWPQNPSPAARGETR